MKLRAPAQGEYLYAVAIREGSDLWLTLWVRRKLRGDVFVLVPRAERLWNPHASYHVDGTLHVKSYNRASLSTKRQALAGTFKGTENVCCFGGHDTKGEICDPSIFAGVIEVAPGVLGPHDGVVCVDLVEPGSEPLTAFKPGRVVRREIFCDVSPCVAITIWSLG